MIVITHLRTDRVYHLMAGDVFHLSFRQGITEDVVIEEHITENVEIDFIASFRFTQDDGTCLGLHASGIFANQKNLPEEMKAAKLMHELTPEQLANFERTCGIKFAEGEV